VQTHADEFNCVHAVPLFALCDNSCSIHDILIFLAKQKGSTVVKKMLSTMIVSVAIVGCTQTEKGAAIGGVGGAAVGAAVTGDAGGAIIGGVAGATAGALIGNASEPGRCYYRGRDGRRYIAAC
jgi:hypothetical protein